MFALEHFFVLGPPPEKLVTGEYSFWLIALSLFIAIGASYMAMTLAAAARRSQAVFMERLHLLSGSASLGLGIWSMHFIGMLAFQMPTQVHYHPGFTTLSAVPSLIASWVTLSLLSRHELTPFRLMTGGLAVGSGIGAMHYLGMAAMEIGPALRYDPGLFVVSIIVAVTLGTLALWVSFGLRHQRRLKGYKRRLLAGAIMGLAIAGMHYTAMEAARFIGTPEPDLNQYRLIFASDGERALQLARTEKPALILLDVMMPGLSGYEVCETLKRDSRTSRIPVIFVTALSDVDDEARGFELGAVDYVTKPVSAPIVRARVKNHLSLLRVDELLETRLAVIQRLGRARISPFPPVSWPSLMSSTPSPASAPIKRPGRLRTQQN